MTGHDNDDTVSCDDVSCDDAATRDHLDAAREQYLAATAEPTVATLFDENPWAQSITLLVAQYYNDEADDAVHAQWVISQHRTPDLETLRDIDHWDYEGDQDPPPDLNLPDHVRNDPRRSDQLDLYWNTPDGGWRRRNWAPNDAAIPALAAYCVDGGEYRPFRIWRRDTDGTITSQTVGTRVRPWLDGVPGIDAN